MEKNKTVSGLKKQLAAAIAMVLVAAISLGTSTYAWFVNNTKVTAGTTKVSATTAHTLLIENENHEWATTYDFGDTETHINFVPVSTIGKNSADEFKFFTQNDWAKNTSNKITVNKVSNATAGSYWKKDFQIKASQACKLYLDTDTKFEAGAGSTMNKVLRLALVIKDSDGTWKNTVIYQIDPDTNGVRYNTTLEDASSADGINNAISGFDTTGGTGATEGAAQVGAIVSPATKQIGSSTSRDYALATAGADNSLNATVGSADELYAFTKNNEVVKITAYIWMEGCDHDCNNDTVATITGAANTVTATLGFCAGQN